MRFQIKQRYGISDLLEIVEILRAPDGCPWDREQTHHSIRKNFIEETYEVVEAIDNGDIPLLREELGDVLLQVALHTQMEKEQDHFDFDAVCDCVCKKLIRRHPHIFSGTVANTAEEVLRNWEEIKKQEKRQQTDTEALRAVPRVLPALMRSEKVQKRAAKSGFEYPDPAFALKDLCSELQELQQAIQAKDQDAIFEELGDLLFSAVNVSRFYAVDPEHSLAVSCDKFISRFERVEALAAEQQVNMAAASPDMLDRLWQEAKNKE